MAKLVFIDTRFVGCTYELTGGKITIGRSPQNRLVLPEKSVSSAHCEILVNLPEVIIRDLGSRNGTVVNGSVLRNGQTQLKHGQMMQVGSVCARLELDEPQNTTVGFTAVREHQRALRNSPTDNSDQNRATRAAPIERNSGHTVLVPVEERTTTAPNPQFHTSRPETRPQPNRTKTRTLLLLFAVAAILGGIAWLIFR